VSRICDLLKRADEHRAKAEAHKAMAEGYVSDAQQACTHPDVVEGEHLKGFLDTQPPFSVCRVCGYAEEGWGYWKLPQFSPRVDRETARKLVRGRIWSQEAMSNARFGRAETGEI
jgi:hypothetical protein